MTFNLIDAKPTGVSQTKLRIAVMPFSRRADLSRRFAGPALERVIKGARFLITQ